MSTVWSGASAEVPVSVVIPCFQAHATLPRAVKSVAQQSARPRELIIVDDASGADTAAVLRELQQHYGTDWLRIVRLERNQGAATARNAGWEAARGEYVAFLDADDSWLPAKVERQLGFMRAHPEFALSGHRALYGDAATAPAAPSVPVYSEISGWSVLLRNPMVTPSIMVRHSVTQRFEDQARHMEDHRLLQQLVFSGARIARVEEPLALIHKAAFGAGGLSADLWAMERAELDNYRALRRAGHIGVPVHALVATYSLAKYARRCAMVALRRLGD
jgi:glycosyltransferase involved in cell wall biosynthesis